VSVLYVLVPLALAIVFAAVIAYVWSARTGQFDDLQTPAFRPLLDDRPSQHPAAAPKDPVPPAS
jgi:cbb3-type cytochrome oxidase maturation protein